MATLERRIDALESRRGICRSAGELTDRELLSLVAPGYMGPVPSDDEMPKFIGAYMAKQGIPWPQCLIDPTAGDVHGDA